MFLILWPLVEPLHESAFVKVCWVFSSFISICQTTFFCCKITSSLSLTYSLQKSSFCQWLCCIQLFPLLPPCPYNSCCIASYQIWKAMLSKQMNFTPLINLSTPQIGQLPISSIFFFFWEILPFKVFFGRSRQEVCSQMIRLLCMFLSLQANGQK